MQGRKNKKVVTGSIVFSVIILAVLAVYFYWPYIFLTKAERLNVAGYCVKENRYLTDQEKLDIVAWNIVNGRAITFEDAACIKNGKLKTYAYSSVEEFYAVNPDCFKFVDTVRIPDGPYETIPFYAKYHGRLSTLIEVDYLFGFDTRQDNLPIRMRTTYGLSNCGDFVKEPEYLVLKFRYGI